MNPQELNEEKEKSQKISTPDLWEEDLTDEEFIALTFEQKCNYFTKKMVSNLNSLDEEEKELDQAKL